MFRSTLPPGTPRSPVPAGTARRPHLRLLRAVRFGTPSCGRVVVPRVFSTSHEDPRSCASAMPPVRSQILRSAEALPPTAIPGPFWLEQLEVRHWPRQSPGIPAVMHQSPCHSSFPALPGNLGVKALGASLAACPLTRWSSFSNDRCIRLPYGGGGVPVSAGAPAAGGNRVRPTTRSIAPPWFRPRDRTRVRETREPLLSGSLQARPLPAPNLDAAPSASRSAFPGASD